MNLFMVLNLNLINFEKYKSKKKKNNISMIIIGKNKLNFNKI